MLRLKPVCNTAEWRGWVPSYRGPIFEVEFPVQLITEDGSGRQTLWRSPRSTRCSEQRQLQQAEQHFAQLGFECISENGDYLSGQTLLVFDHPHSKIYFFLILKSPSSIWLCAISLSLSHWAPVRRAWFRFLYSPHIRYLYTLMSSPLRLPFSRLNSPTFLSLSSYEILQSLNHLSGRLLDSLQYVRVGSVLCIAFLAWGSAEWAWPTCGPA